MPSHLMNPSNWSANQSRVAELMVGLVTSKLF